MVAGATGLEPATSCVTGRRSNQTELRPRNLSLVCGAQEQNRTADTGIFSPLLYRLSYLGSTR